MAPLLPLDRFRHILGYSPYHFWGMAGDVVPVTSACNTILSRYAYQDADSCGREEIIRAIETAEAQLTSYLGFSVAPHYVTETIPWPPYYDKALWRTGRAGSDGRQLAVQLSEGEVRAVGTELLTLVGVANVAYADLDGDGLSESWTATIATTETDPDRLAVYVAAADRLDSAPVSAEWRIEPVTISIAAGTATIRGRAWLMVKPVLYEGFNPSALDPSTSTHFITTVDVYTRTTDTTVQATLIWETVPWPGCVASGTDPAAVGTAVARVGIRDATVGLVTPGAAVYDATSGTWSATAWGTWRPPDRATISYLAGAALVGEQMAQRWQTIVARLAAAELARPICACDMANRELFRWQTDLARTNGGADEAFGAISAADLANPLGTRRGHVYAWKAIVNLGHATGLLA